jgi:hypothetical protein
MRDRTPLCFYTMFLHNVSLLFKDLHKYQTIQKMNAFRVAKCRDVFLGSSKDLFFDDVYAQMYFKEHFIQFACEKVRAMVGNEQRVMSANYFELEPYIWSILSKYIMYSPLISIRIYRNLTQQTVQIEHFNEKQHAMLENERNVVRKMAFIHARG